MPKRKQFRKFGARYLIRNVVVMTASGLLGLALWCMQFPPWTLFIVFIATVVTLMIVEELGFRNFPCLSVAGSYHGWRFLMGSVTLSAFCARNATLSGRLALAMMIKLHA